MKPGDKKYILDNVDKKTVNEIARDLGLRERKIRKFLEKRNVQPGNIRGHLNFLKRSFIPKEGLFRKDKYSKISESFIFSAIILGAFIVRIIYIYQIRTNPFFVPFHHGLDDYLYDVWARSIASGNVLGSEVFYGLPLYPYFLGFLYFVFDNSVFLAKLAQFFIGSLSCALLYLIGRRVFNRFVGVVSAVVMIFYSEMIFYEGFYVSAFLAIFLNFLVILLLLSIKDKPNSLKCLVTGGLIGLSSLANASALIFLVFVLFWMAQALKKLSVKRRLICTLLLLSGTILAIMPVTVRNYAISKDFVPITYHGGITFYAGNNPLAEGTFRLPVDVGSSVIDSKKNAELIAESVRGEKLKPSEISNFWFDQGMAFIKNDPAGYLDLTIRKMLLFWNAHEIPDILPMAFFRAYAPLLNLPLFNYAFILPLAIFGMIVCVRCINKDIILLYLFIFGVFVSTSVYFVNSRYRLIAVPYLIIFAAVTVYLFYRSIRNRQYGFMATGVVALLVLTGITQTRMHEVSLAQAHNNLGIILKRQGSYDEAIREYKRAIEIQPDYGSPYFNLGLLYYEKGQFENSIEFFDVALEVNPGNIKAHNYIGNAYAKTGDRGKAMLHWRRSLELDPDQSQIRRLVGE